MVLKLDVFSHMSDRSFGLDSLIKLRLSLVLLLRVDT